MHEGGVPEHAAFPGGREAVGVGTCSSGSMLTGAPVVHGGMNAAPPPVATQPPFTFVPVDDTSAFPLTWAAEAWFEFTWMQAPFTVAVPLPPALSASAALGLST